MSELKKLTKLLLAKFGYQLSRLSTNKDTFDFTPDEIDLIKKVKPFTMTSIAKLETLALAVKYVNKNGINGDFVECGVWRGGSIALAISMDAANVTGRKYWLYDTFDGMTRPSDRDSVEAHLEYANTANATGGSDWCASTENEVQQNLQTLGVDLSRCEFVVGDVSITLKQKKPSEISILRLDTDWYESTLVELNELYSLLAIGGVLILDDYGYWEGARGAVDDFFSNEQFKPLLQPIDHSGRIAIKVK